MVPHKKFKEVLYVQRLERYREHFSCQEPFIYDVIHRSYKIINVKLTCLLHFQPACSYRGKARPDDSVGLTGPAGSMSTTPESVSGRKHH